MQLPQEFLEEFSNILHDLGCRLASIHEDMDFVYIRIEEILNVLSRFSETTSIPNAPEVLRSLVSALEILDSCQCTVLNGCQAPIIRSGKTGRPRFDISKEHLEFLLEFDFTVPEIARLLDVSVRTIRRRMKELELSVKQCFTDISEEDLQ